MPIEDIKLAPAPRDWRPTPDQASRINSDPRLRRMTRDDQYRFFNQQPSGAQPQSARQRAEQAAGNAMSWHPAVIFRHIADRLRQATGN